MLLIVAHALRHVSSQNRAKEGQAPLPQPAPIVLSPELVDTLRALLAQTTVSEEHQETPQITETASATEPDETISEEQPTPAENVLLTVSHAMRNELVL